VPRLSHLPVALPKSATALAPVAALVALAGAGCGAGKHTTTNSVAAISSKGKQIGNLSTPGTPKGEQTVKIQVVAETGRQRAAMALVPIYIDGKGPYPFAVDTGASRSLIAAGLASRLKLPEVGSAGVISGITGSSRAVNVRIGNWRAGSISLPPTLLAAMESSSSSTSKSAPPSPPSTKKSGGVQGPIGLLGSDVLSRYGKVAIDYDKGLLILDPPVK
jgi:hypothetical protein